MSCSHGGTLSCSDQRCYGIRWAWGATKFGWWLQHVQSTLSLGADWFYHPSVSTIINNSNACCVRSVHRKSHFSRQACAAHQDGLATEQGTWSGSRMKHLCHLTGAAYAWLKPAPLITLLTVTTAMMELTNVLGGLPGE